MQVVSTVAAEPELRLAHLHSGAFGDWPILYSIVFDLEPPN